MLPSTRGHGGDCTVPFCMDMILQRYMTYTVIVTFSTHIFSSNNFVMIIFWIIFQAILYILILFDVAESFSCDFLLSSFKHLISSWMTLSSCFKADNIFTVLLIMNNSAFRFFISFNSFNYNKLTFLLFHYVLNV